MQIGTMRAKVGFYQPIVQSDGAGNRTAGYGAAADFTARASMRPKFRQGLPIAGLHPEGAAAGGVASRQLVNVTVRQSTATRGVTTAWKLRDQRAGVDYNIRSIIDPEQGQPGAGTWLELLCESGVAL